MLAVGRGGGKDLDTVYCVFTLGEGIQEGLDLIGQGWGYSGIEALAQ